MVLLYSPGYLRVGDDIYRLKGSMTPHGRPSRGRIKGGSMTSGAESGEEIGNPREYSEQTAKEYGDVSGILAEWYKKAVEILEKNSDALDALVSISMKKGSGWR
jgi:hypothetical protein